MTRAKTLNEAVALVADGDRVIVTIDGVEVGMIPADEVADIEAMEDRYWAKEGEKALAEPGESVGLEDVVKELEAERSARRAVPKMRRQRVGR